MIEAKDLEISFSGETIVKGLSFYVPRGSKATLQGRSGSGKSSVLLSLLGFVKPVSGEIIINGQLLDESTVKQIRSTTAWVPQELGINLEYARDLLFLPFSFKLNKALYPTSEETYNILTLFGLHIDILDKPLKELSGGEKQRISLCSAFLQKKPLILLDEPTSALDAKTKSTVTKFFMQSNKHTILSASHDDLWAKYNDLVIDITKYH